MSKRSDSWSGRLGFILATVDSAVGIGSIWKFPYEVGANGGMAFVLFYLAGLALIVVPLMFAEFAVGRRGRGDAASSIAALARAHGAGRHGAGRPRALIRVGKEGSPRRRKKGRTQSEGERGLTRIRRDKRG
ncbi:MAG: hypothetical protein ACREEE_18950 [Dongiaceae bacterium]